MVPQPIHDFTTPRVLTMDYVRGKKVTAVGPLARLELDGEEVAALTEAMGVKLPDFDSAKLTRTLATLVAEHREATLEELAIGRLMLAVARESAEAGLRLPPQLSLLGKTLLQLDEIGRAIAPGFNPNEAVRRHAVAVTRERLRKSATPSNLLAALQEAKEFVERLPGRTNRILDLVAGNELRVQVDAIDEQLLMEGFQKVANRISVGLILAALILGAAMLMQVSTPFRLFGYPGLAILCFLGAAAGGVGLVINILWNDRKARSPRRSPR